MAVAMVCSMSSPKRANPIPSGRNCTVTSAAVVVVVSGALVVTVVSGAAVVTVVSGATVVVVVESKGSVAPLESSPHAATTNTRNVAARTVDLSLMPYPLGAVSLSGSAGYRSQLASRRPSATGRSAAALNPGP